jgi:hypothetical protein
VHGAPSPGRVLAVDIDRDGFAWALSHAALSHFDRKVHTDPASWKEQVNSRSVRVQWDPERDLHHRPLEYRVSRDSSRSERQAVIRYADDWIQQITDVTGTMRAIGTLVAADRLGEALELLPEERPYALSEELAKAVGSTV